jgi:dynein heavy chain
LFCSAWLILLCKETQNLFKRKAHKQVQELEEAASRFGKQVGKLGHDIKHWEIWQQTKDRIDAFKKTMPLISDLRNPAMRPRHWHELMKTIQTQFDPASNVFTLDSIVQLRLDQHAEFIGEMSMNASKELAIEQSINAIAEIWKSMDLDIVCARPLLLPCRVLNVPGV